MTKQDFKLYKQFSIKVVELEKAIKSGEGQKITDIAGDMARIVVDIKDKKTQNLLNSLFDYIVKNVR